MKVAILILAGGRGTRANCSVPKQYQKLNGKSILRRTIDCFVQNPDVQFIRVVINSADIDIYNEESTSLDILEPVFGGRERHISARNGIESLLPISPDVVLIHDAARPFVSKLLVNRIIAKLHNASGVIPAIRVTDTLKRVNSDTLSIIQTVDRQDLWRAQTPQGFRFQDILNAHRKIEKHVTVTDDASIMENAGYTVEVVHGEERNIKITVKEDFTRAKTLIGSENSVIRVGMGFDVHKLELGTGVHLCGVKIPCDLRLIGHSDADVAMHALTDAILGATGCGDIGEHFPPSEQKWKGMASSYFLQFAVDNLQKLGGHVINVDITIICEFPKVGPFRDQMRKKIARLLFLSNSSVNIKATTTENLGFIGRGEGIAVQVIANIVMPNS